MRGAAPHRTVGEAAFRQALGRFATGVALITATVGEEPVGLVASSVASVSLQPALVSFCPSRGSRTWRRMRGAGRFGINVLGEHHEAYVRRAAPPGADRFAGVEHRPGPGGLPLLADAVAFVACTIAAEHPAGDHWIVVGRVDALLTRIDAPPLVFWAGRFRALAQTPAAAPRSRAGSHGGDRAAGSAPSAERLADVAS